MNWNPVRYMSISKPPNIESELKKATIVNCVDVVENVNVCPP
jgi:hypothetical protein